MQSIVLRCCLAFPLPTLRYHTITDLQPASTTWLAFTAQIGVQVALLGVAYVWFRFRHIWLWSKLTESRWPGNCVILIHEICKTFWHIYDRTPNWQFGFIYISSDLLYKYRYVLFCLDTTNLIGCWDFETGSPNERCISSFASVAFPLLFQLHLFCLLIVLKSE